MSSKAFFRYVICGAAIQTATFLIASLGQKLDFRHRRSSSSREVVCTSGCKVELQGPIFSSVCGSEVCEHSCHNVVLIYLLMWRDAFTVESGKCGSDMKMLFIHFCHAYCNKKSGYEDNLFRYHAIYRNEWMTQRVLTGQQQDNCCNAVHFCAHLCAWRIAVNWLVNKHSLSWVNILSGSFTSPLCLIQQVGYGW